VSGGLVLTLDAGGSGVKASVYRPETSELLTCVRAAWRPSIPAPGRAEWDPEAWWAIIVDATREAVRRSRAAASEFAGIACAGMRIPFVLLDARRRPVAPGVLTIDRRGAVMLAELEERVGARELYRRTGHWINERFGLPKLLWFARMQPREWERTRHVLQLHDWLVERLSGEIVSEPSSASMSQLLDVGRRAWATDLLGALGLDADRLPPLVDGGTAVGGLLPELASELGLAAGTPVHAGGGDSHLACLGSCSERAGVVGVVAGSTTPIQSTDLVPRLSEAYEPLVSCHPLPGRWVSETNAGETGVLYRWLCDLLGTGERLDFEAVSRLAETSEPGSGGLLVLAAQPVWGRAAWSRSAPVTLLDVKPDHTASDVARAVLECACYATAGALVPLEALRGERISAVVATGGASRSPAWAQMLADVLGREVRVPRLEEPTARAGAQLVTGHGGASPAETVYAADPARHAVYGELVECHRDAHARLLDAFGNGA
jgi:sugar (pentulose or hexulose) kinase